MIKNRNIVLCIILTLVTCGIYGLYWFVCITNDSNAATNVECASGGKALLFTLLTCGLYSFYWSFKMGQKYDVLKGNAGGNSGILFIVLSCIGLGIVNYCLVQNELNKVA